MTMTMVSVKKPNVRVWFRAELQNVTDISRIFLRVKFSLAVLLRVKELTFRKSDSENAV